MGSQWSHLPDHQDHPGSPTAPQDHLQESGITSTPGISSTLGHQHPRTTHSPGYQPPGDHQHCQITPRITWTPAPQGTNISGIPSTQDHSQVTGTSPGSPPGSHPGQRWDHHPGTRPHFREKRHKIAKNPLLSVTGYFIPPAFQTLGRAPGVRRCRSTPGYPSAFGLLTQEPQNSLAASKLEIYWGGVFLGLGP